MEKKTMLVAEHIDKRFGMTHAVNDVSINIAAGEVRALIGENGSGKSTFCQMLCGIYTTSCQQHVRNAVDQGEVQAAFQIIAVQLLQKTTCFDAFQGGNIVLQIICDGVICDLH